MIPLLADSRFRDRLGSLRAAASELARLKDFMTSRTVYLGRAVLRNIILD